MLADNPSRPIGIAYLGLVVLTVAIALAGVYLYADLRPMAFLEGGYPVWKAKQGMLDNCDLGSVAFFGDSQLDSAIIPNRLPDLATNFGFAGGTPLEGYFFVKRSLECSARPARIVLSFGPAAFQVVQPWLWENAVRYGVLGWNDLEEIRATAKEIGDETYFSIRTHDGLTGSLRDFLYLSHFPSIYFNSLVEARLFQREERNVAKFAEVRQARGYPAYGAGGGVVQPSNAKDEFRPLPLQRHYFKQTVAMLDRAGVQVDFLITPVNTERYPAGKRHSFDAYLGFLHGMEARYPHFRLLQGRVPLWSRAMFADAAHLNAAGARNFSDLLGRCIASDAQGQRSPASARCDFALN